jgi:hypothetical protein
MHASSAATDSVPETTSAATSSPTHTAVPRSWAPTATGGPPSTVAPDQPMRFAMQEAIRLARQGQTTQAAAYDILRWATRQRSVLQAALDELRLDATTDAETRDSAAGILERVLAVGFLY